jgi:poly(A) polymerase
LAPEMVALTRSAILEGDRFEGVPVLGFAFVGPAGETPVTAEQDRLLLAGDEHLDQPPDRRVPRGPAASIAYTAVLPAQRLPDDRKPAVADALGDNFATLLSLPDRSWADFVAELIADLHAEGHVVWLSGGAVRDVVAEGDPSTVNDLDMAGTAPAGQFTDIAYRRLALAGKALFRQRVSADLICSISDGRDSIIEYKGLHQGGFRFQTTGADLQSDTESRDFTVNALFYDPVRRQLLDPGGQGLSDLAADPRRLVPMDPLPDALNAADIVLRAIKFIHRWRAQDIAVDDTAVRHWVAGLPPDIWHRIDTAECPKLRRMSEKVSAKVPAAEARTIAKELGANALDLFNLVLWGTDGA